MEHEVITVDDLMDEVNKMIDRTLMATSNDDQSEIMAEFIQKWSYMDYRFRQNRMVEEVKPKIEKETNTMIKDRMMRNIRKSLIDEIASRIVNNLNEDELAEAIGSRIDLDKIASDNAETAFDYVVDQLVEEVGEFDDSEYELHDRVMEIIND
jgi:hypothetical protein